MITKTRRFVFDWWVIQKRVVYLLGAFLIVTREAGVSFKKETRSRLQTGVDGGGFPSAANEKSGSRKQGQGKRDLRHHQRIAREKFPAASDGIFARLFLKIGDHGALRNL